MSMEKLFGKYQVLPLEKGAGQTFEDKIDEYDDTMCPPSPDAPQDEDFVLKIEDAHGKIIAGCNFGIFNWSQMEVDVLWVDEVYRHLGLASMLLKEAERIARERKCYLSMLGTFDFQARPLYEKHGYKVQAVREEWPKGHCNYTMTKRLEGTLVDYVPSNHTGWDKYEIKQGNEEDADIIVDGLVAHNDKFAPDKHDYLRLNKKVVDDDGNVIAGIVAGVGGWDDGIIHHLWVEEPYRHQGIGNHLLRLAEQEMKDNGAYAIFVSSFDWVADFYIKNGYEIIGCIDDFPRGHRCYDFCKSI